MKDNIDYRKSEWSSRSI